MKKLILVLISLMLIISLISCENVEENSKTDIVDNPIEKQKNVYCKIKFEENGGTSVEDMSVLKGSDLKEGPKTTRNNYLFDGWYLDQSLITPAVFPLEITSDKTLYAKWILTTRTQGYEGCNIKWDTKYESGYIYSITPSGFDLEALTQKGFNKIKITISYTVYYTKDYNVLLDIGYAGSPKYEVSIYNQNKEGLYYKDLPTTKQEKTNTYEYSINISEINSTRLDLKLSTNNIQNVIHFKDISVTYTAAK